MILWVRRSFLEHQQSLEIRWCDTQCVSCISMSKSWSNHARVLSCKVITTTMTHIFMLEPVFLTCFLCIFGTFQCSDIVSIYVQFYLWHLFRSHNTSVTGKNNYFACLKSQRSFSNLKLLRKNFELSSSDVLRIHHMFTKTNAYREISVNLKFWCCCQIIKRDF